MTQTIERTGKRRPRQDSPVREKILNVASELFYRNGIRAVGVDTVVAESGAAKTSLYRWFPTKDDLVAAFLERALGQGGCGQCWPSPAGVERAFEVARRLHHGAALSRLPVPQYGD